MELDSFEAVTGFLGPPRLEDHDVAPYASSYTEVKRLTSFESTDPLDEQS